MTTLEKKKHVAAIIDELRAFALESLEDGMGEDLDPVAFVDSAWEIFKDLADDKEER